MILVFLVILAVPAVLMIRQIRFLVHARRCTERLDGTVVGLEERIAFGRRGRSDFIPAVSYTFQGEDYTAPAFQRVTYDTYSVNGSVTVYADPDDPAHFVLERERGAARTGITVYALCFLVLAIVFAAAWAEDSRRQKQQDALHTALSEMEEKLLAGEEEALEDFIDDQVIRVVNGKEVN